MKVNTIRMKAATPTPGALIRTPNKNITKIMIAIVVTLSPLPNISYLYKKATPKSDFIV
jgi:hypothetical protein